MAVILSQARNTVDMQSSCIYDMLDLDLRIPLETLFSAGSGRRIRVEKLSL